MAIDTNLSIYLSFATLIGSVVIAPVLGEWRATRQRRWILERERVTHEKLNEIDAGVRGATETAAAAYEAANHVNEWRNEITTTIHAKQDATFNEVREAKAILTDTNKKVTTAADRPAPPPLIILGTQAAAPPEEKC